MKKKLVLVLCAVLALTAVFTLAGCGSSQEDPLSDNTLNVGVEATYIPMEYKDDNNNLTGFDIEFGEALAKQLSTDLNKDISIEWKDTSWDGIFTGLDAGQYDCVISCVSLTQERQENYFMSTPYVSNGVVIASRTDETAATKAEDLEGKTVGVQLETTADIAAQAIRDKDGVNLELKQFDSIMEAFSALEGHQIDYVMTDEPVGEYYANKKSDVYQVTSDILSNEPVSVCIKKSNEDFGNQVNTAIQEMQEDGTLKELSVKWFGKDMTKDIDAEDLTTLE